MNICVFFAAPWRTAILPRCRSSRHGSSPHPPGPPVRRPRLPDPEANRPPLRPWRRHELADGVEHDLELGVVLLFRCGSLTHQILVQREQSSQLHKSAPHEGKGRKDARQ